MSRKKLRIKPEFIKNKRIQLKRSLNLSDIFELDKGLYFSGFALTDNYNTVLFFIDDEFLEKNDLTNQINEFNLNENDLQIKYDNQNMLVPKILLSAYDFHEIGQIERSRIDWFFKHYPDCVFYPVTEWFGKSVNTLVIVLREQFGKVVGVVKTH